MTAVDEMPSELVREFFAAQREETPLDWMADGLCAQTDPEVFFPDKGGSTVAAKRICSACDVRARCLAYALDNGERFGIWGGLSERERRVMRVRPNGRPEGWRPL